MTGLRLEPLPDSQHDAWLAEERERRFRWITLPLHADEARARRRAAEDLDRVLPDGTSTPGHEL